MCVLGRFLVSDEFILDWKMFCVILDRKEIFEISNNEFFAVGHVTIQNMEMSEIALRIEWKHFQIPAGPASGRNCPLKSRNLGFGHIGTFFRSFREFEKWEVPRKKVTNPEQTFSGRMEPVRGQSVAWRSRELRNGPSPARKARVRLISLAGYPIFDLARFGLQGPRVCPAQRGMMVLGDTSTLVHPGAHRGNLPVS